jgi:hypothetical protein
MSVILLGVTRMKIFPLFNVFLLVVIWLNVMAPSDLVFSQKEEQSKKVFGWKENMERKC